MVRRDAYVNRVNTAQTSCFRVYTRLEEQKGASTRFMRNILGDIQDHITVARVHPERIGSLRQERVRRAGVLRRGMHRFRSECSPMFRYSSLATSGEVFILLFLLLLLSPSSSSSSSSRCVTLVLFGRATGGENLPS